MEMERPEAVITNFITAYHKLYVLDSDVPGSLNVVNTNKRQTKRHVKRHKVPRVNLLSGISLL
jgi:hypothetical protein